MKEGSDREMNAVVGAEWLELEVVRMAELADYVEREARDDEERVRALRRLLAKMAEEGAARGVPEQVDGRAGVAFFHAMGVCDPYMEVATAGSVKSLVERQEGGLWERWSGEVCAAYVLWHHLREIVEERVGRLEEGLALLGRGEGKPTRGRAGRMLPHFDLLTDDMALDIMCRGLVAGGYLHPGTKEAEWRYVCKGEGRAPDGPLVWTGKKNEFKLMVTTLFRGQAQMWERALGCFVHTTGPFSGHIRNAHLPLGDDSERLKRSMGRYGGR